MFVLPRESRDTVMANVTGSSVFDGHSLEINSNINQSEVLQIG